MGAGVFVEGTAACNVAAQSGVGEAFPAGAIKAGNPWEGRLQLINTRKTREMGISFFMLALDQPVIGAKFIGFNGDSIFREIAIVHIAAST